MTSFNEDEYDGSKRRWLEDTHEARRNAMEIRRKIPPEAVRTPPFDVPELVDYYNRLLHEYAGQLRPKERNLGEFWGELLTTVEVPVDGSTVDAGAIDAVGAGLERYIYKAPWAEREVRLKTLREDWVVNAGVSVTVRAHDPWQGEVEREIAKSLYLPVYAADQVLDQLNQCVNFLGWLPKAEVPEYRAGEDEVLTHE